MVYPLGPNPKGHLTLPIMKGGPKILFQSQPYFLDQNFLEQNLLNKFFSRQKIFFTTFFYQPFCLTYKILGVTFLDQFLLDKIFFEQHFVYQTFSDQLFLRPTSILKKLYWQVFQDKIYFGKFCWTKFLLTNVCFGQ